MDSLDWTALPGHCLTLLGSLLNTKDNAAARGVCVSWASALPLKQVCISLPVSACGLTRSAGAKINLLQQALECHAAVYSAKQLSLCFLPVSTVYTRTSAPSTQLSAQQQQLHMQLAQVVNLFPSLSCLDITVGKPAQRPLWLDSADNTGVQGPAITDEATRDGSPTGRAAADTGCNALVLQLLALPKLQRQLRSLNLTCRGPWPQHAHLSATLLQLQNVTSLQLRDCPLATVIKLPSMPQLASLSVSGRFTEPAPRSYSVRSQPLLPLLPALRRLAIQSLPYNMQWQERNDVRALLKGVPHCQQQSVLATIPGTEYTVAVGSETHSSRQLNQRQMGPSLAAPHQSKVDWRSMRQYVTYSIQQQCPFLQQLDTDMVLGGQVLQLPHLRRVTAPHMPQPLESHQNTAVEVLTLQPCAAVARLAAATSWHGVGSGQVSSAGVSTL